MRLQLMLITSIFSTCHTVFLQIECKIKIKNSIFTTIFLFIYLLLHKKDNNGWKMTTFTWITDTMVVCYGYEAARLRIVIYSQRGNVLFPTWEYFIPSVGIISL